MSSLSSKPHSLPAIVLAAGLSSRMGAFKPLLPIAGKPLLLHTLAALQASGSISSILVVTGHRAAELQTTLPSYAHFVFNPQFATGEMLSSITTGIRELATQHSTTPPFGFLLALGDQPAVSPNTVRLLVDGFYSAFQPPPLVIPNHLGKKGHPMVLSWTLTPAIQALPPGDTIRTVVQQHLPQACMMTVDDPWVLEDLDTPEDLAKLQARWSPA